MSKIDEVIQNIHPLNEEVLIKAQEKLNNLTKPKGSLGKLEELAKRVAGITGNLKPSLKKKVIFVFAADHGVAKEGVSAYPQEVTYQMVYNFLKGGAGINVLSRHIGAKVIVVDVGVAKDINPHPNLRIKKIGYGTANMTGGPAMSKKEAIQSIRTGIEVFEDEFNQNGIDIVGLGDMGIANTTASSAVLATFRKEKIENITGRGTGLNNKGWMRKVEVIKKALQVNLPDSEDPLDVLAKVGGYEIGAIAGCLLSAASFKVPVVIDGFISTAGALIALKLAPLSKDYVFASHLSKENGHRIALDYLGLSPLLDLDLRLGEGTGAALGISLIEAGVKILTQMATFSEAGVSAREEDSQYDK